jgi:hypothetical protein
MYLPAFDCETATDNDPNDFAVFNLMVATDSTFANPIQSVNGLLEAVFQFADSFEDNTRYYWRVDAVDTDGLITSSEIFSFEVGSVSVGDRVGIPEDFYLSQNYPNPFNPTTVVEFGVKLPGHVRLEVYNLQGSLVATLQDDEMPAGHHSVVWSPNGLASGLYLVRMTANEFVDVKKISFLK